MPCSRAVTRPNGLKAEPGFRRPFVARSYCRWPASRSVPKSRHHESCAGCVVDHGDRTRWEVAARREPLLEDAARFLLKAEVDGGEDAQAAAAFAFGVIGGTAE